MYIRLPQKLVSKWTRRCAVSTLCYFVKVLPKSWQRQRLLVKYICFAYVILNRINNVSLRYWITCFLWSTISYFLLNRARVVRRYECILMILTFYLFSLLSSIAARGFHQFMPCHQFMPYANVDIESYWSTYITLLTRRFGTGFYFQFCFLAAILLALCTRCNLLRHYPGTWYS